MELTPNTIEWFMWRLNGVGSSDSPVLMGKSKYKTKLQLWDEKFKKVIPQDAGQPNYIQQKGHEIEAWARPGLEFSTGLPWRPATFIHSSFDFIRATLDGWQPSLLEAWECKLMGKEMFEKLRDESLPLKDRIPVEYFDQIMHHFFVTGAKAVRLTGVIEHRQDDERTKEAYTLYIPFLEEFQDYVNKTLAPEIFNFWKSVQEGKRPEPEKTDRLEITDEDLANHIKWYGELSAEEKRLKEIADQEFEKIMGEIPKKVAEVKEYIEKHPARNHPKMEYAGFKIVEVSGKEIIDYEAAFNAFIGWIKQVKTASPGEIVHAVKEFPDEPSLEKYTRSGKPSLRITPPKKEEATTTVVKESEITTDVVKPKKGRPKKIKKTEKEERIEEAKKVMDQPLPEPKVDPNDPSEKTKIRTKEKVAEWKTLNPRQQAVVAMENAFRNPDTDNRPLKWESMSRAERITYLRTTKVSAPGDRKFMLELADKLENLNQIT
jgi:putative phage-type endonuclease